MRPVREILFGDELRARCWRWLWQMFGYAVLCIVGETIAESASLIVDGMTAKLAVWAVTLFAFVFLWTVGVLWWEIRGGFRAAWRFVLISVNFPRGRQESCVADEMAEYGKRLRDLEAEAFRTGRILAGHSGQLTTTSERQHADFNHAVEQRLGTIEHILFALARAQGIDLGTPG